MQREKERRMHRDLIETIDSFIQARPDATWDFAAGPDTHNAVIEGLSPRTRERVKRALSKNLVNQPVEQLRSAFNDAPLKRPS